METTATKFPKAPDMSTCRIARRSQDGSKLTPQELDRLAEWIGAMRAEFGLPQKAGQLSSNLILPTREQEMSHLLRVEFDDMFNELCESECAPSRSACQAYAGIRSERVRELLAA